MRSGLLGLVLLLSSPPILSAGLHHVPEIPLPRTPDTLFFLQRQLMALRAYGPADPKLNKEDAPLRKEYLALIEQLRRKHKQGALSADEIANFGYYLIRVRGTFAEPNLYLMEAIDLLVPASSQYRDHFAIHSNLGTAFQLLEAPEALRKAEDHLSMAVELAPPEWREFERTQLLLVKVRKRAAMQPRPGGNRLSDLPEPDEILAPPSARFRFVGPSGQWEVGKLAETERQKIPGGDLARASSQVQQLLIWLPYDNRLVWLLGELANAQGQLPAAQEALEKIFNTSLTHPELYRRKRLLENYRRWQEVLERSSVGPEMWLAGNLAAGLTMATPAGSTGCLEWSVQARSNLKAASLEGGLDVSGFNGGAAVGLPSTENTEPRELLQLTTKHWLLMGVGVLLVLMFLTFQFREWRRRQSRKAAPSA
jgi:hypothetical protein